MSYVKNEIKDLIARRTIDFVEIKIQMENHLTSDGAKVTIEDLALAVAQLCDNMVEMAQDLAELQDSARKAGWR